MQADTGVVARHQKWKYLAGMWNQRPDAGEKSGRRENAGTSQPRGEQWVNTKLYNIWHNHIRTPITAMHLAVTLCRALYLQYLQDYLHFRVEKN